MSNSGRTEWPFRLREEIFAHLREPLVSHGPTVIVLRGPAGAGKSRIARECAAWHHRRGRRVTWVGANGSLQTIPWGAFADVDFDVEGSAGEPVSILRELSARIGRDPLEPLMPLLICDDAQYLDDRSAAVVAEVAHRGRASIVLTVREGIRVPEAIRVLIEAEGTVVVPVPVLDRAGVADVLAAVVGQRVRPSIVDQMHALTGGNFLYLRELLRGEMDASRFAPRGDEWIWQRGATLPQGLTHVVADLLDSLDPGMTDLIDLLAIASPLRCSVYERIVGPAVIERAEGEGLVRGAHTPVRVRAGGRTSTLRRGRQGADGHSPAAAAEWASLDGVGCGRRGGRPIPQRPRRAAGRAASPRLGTGHTAGAARRSGLSRFEFHRSRTGRAAVARSAGRKRAPGGAVRTRTSPSLSARSMTAGPTIRSYTEHRRGEAMASRSMRSVIPGSSESSR